MIKELASAVLSLCITLPLCTLVVLFMCAWIAALFAVPFAAIYIPVRVVSSVLGAG